MPDLKRLEEAIVEIVPRGVCPTYKITEDFLRKLDEILKEEEETAKSEERAPAKKGIPKDVFLELVGVPEEEIDDKLKVSTGSITYCIKQQITKRPELRKFNVEFGVHKTDGPELDQVTVKRSIR